jgi:hypothetical protein
MSTLDKMGSKIAITGKMAPGGGIEPSSFVDILVKTKEVKPKKKL